MKALCGVAPRLSYFNGCSAGGRQSFMEAQRFPEDFDAIIAGAPGYNRTDAAFQTMQMLRRRTRMRRASSPRPSCPRFTVRRSMRATVSTGSRMVSSAIPRSVSSILASWSAKARTIRAV